MNKKKELPIYHLFYNGCKLSKHHAKGYKPVRLTIGDLLDIMESFWALDYKLVDITVDDDACWKRFRDYVKRPTRENFYLLYHLLDARRARGVVDLRSVAMIDADKHFILVNCLGAVETNDKKSYDRMFHYIRINVVPELLKKESE